MNQIKLIGNLGKDAEVKTFSSGAKKTNFSMATTERYTNKRGETVSDTQWHNISFWGNSFEELEPQLKKGTTVTLIGKVQYNKFVDKEGKTRYITEIIAQELQIMPKTSKGISVVSTSVASEKGMEHLPF
jgi:single-strand DNA-binding protein